MAPPTATATTTNNNNKQQLLLRLHHRLVPDSDRFLFPIRANGVSANYTIVDVGAHWPLIKYPGGLSLTSAPGIGHKSESPQHFHPLPSASRARLTTGPNTNEEAFTSNTYTWCEYNIRELAIWGGA